MCLRCTERDETREAGRGQLGWGLKDMEFGIKKKLNSHW